MRGARSISRRIIAGAPSAAAAATRLAGHKASTYTIRVVNGSRAALGLAAALVATAVVLASATLSRPTASHATGMPVFERGTLELPFSGLGTALTFGPDGRLYAAFLSSSSHLDGGVYALTLDSETRTVVGVEQIAAGLTYPLGMAFAPADASDSLVLYVSNLALNETYRRRGKVTSFAAPDWHSSEVVTGLPSVIGEFHQTNGLTFDEQGTLFIAQGSGEFGGGDSPLSGAILEAKTNVDGFNATSNMTPTSAAK